MQFKALLCCFVILTCPCALGHLIEELISREKPEDEETSDTSSVLRMVFGFLHLVVRQIGWERKEAAEPVRDPQGRKCSVR